MATYTSTKFKAGDRVLVDPHDDNIYTGMMDVYMGQIVTIKRRSPRFGFYKIIEDGYVWWWCDNCFRAVEVDCSDKIFNVLRGQNV